MAEKKMGTIRAKLYHSRLDDLAAANSFADLKQLPGRHHQLTEDKKDLWSCDLDQPNRLIYKPKNNPIPKDEDGKQILIKINDLEILEITDYHKKG